MHKADAALRVDHSIDEHVAIFLCTQKREDIADHSGSLRQPAKSKEVALWIGICLHSETLSVKKKKNNRTVTTHWREADFTKTDENKTTALDTPLQIQYLTHVCCDEAGKKLLLG